MTTNFINKNNAEVVIFYDTEFNISVVASVCGKNSTTLKTLNYGERKTKLYSYNNIYMYIIYTVVVLSQKYTYNNYYMDYK